MSAAAPSKRAILSLYRQLLRETHKFQEFNVKRTKDGFRRNLKSTEAEATAAYHEGLESLDVVKRQVVIGNMYSGNKLVIEK